jgi:hypothetical protein
MTPDEIALLGAAIAALAKVAPEIATAVEALVTSAVNKQPLTPALLHLEIVASAKALGLDSSKV